MAQPKPMVLSDEQKEIIGHTGGHLQVIACAGSVKTETITRHIARIIVGGIEPGQIVALTERVAASTKSWLHRREAEIK